MAYEYSTKITDNCAKAVGVGLAISTKQSVMICNALRRLPIGKAKKLLEDVTQKKVAIAFTKYNKDMAHRPGPMAAGRYPVKACTEILKLLKSAEANAQFKGLSTGNLHIKHVVAQRGPTTGRFGRHGGNAKRTHIELVLEEVKREAKK